MSQGIFEFEHTYRPSPERLETTRRRVLERLGNGPLPCWDIERDPHRGQAVVHTLRNEGYAIPTVMIGGEPHYRYAGYNGMFVKVTKSMQNAYYQTSHWKRVAQERKGHDQFRCVQCGSGDELETHHWRYVLFNEDVLLDLCTLCKSCHDGIHQEARGSRGIHFPRHVSSDIANQLQSNANSLEQ